MLTSAPVALALPALEVDGDFVRIVVVSALTAGAAFGGWLTKRRRAKAIRFEVRFDSATGPLIPHAVVRVSHSIHAATTSELGEAISPRDWWEEARTAFPVAVHAEGVMMRGQLALAAPGAVPVVVVSRATGRPN